VLEDILERLRTERGVNSNVELTKDVQFYPDFHGTFDRCIWYMDHTLRAQVIGHLLLIHACVDP